MNRYILITGLTAFVSIFFVGCSKNKAAEQTSKVISVKVMNIVFSDNSSTRNYVGTVEESSAISISFSGSGTVERVLVSEGERVSKGQLLAVLNSSTAKNAYEVSKSTLRQAQDAYDRLKTLYEKGSITDIKFVEVETGLEKAKAMEAISKKSLEDCNLYAPMSGVIAKRSVEEGASVMPGLSVFKLVSIDQVNINVSIPENEIGSIKTGRLATVTVPALGNREYKGTIDKKGVEANPISHTYGLKIKVSNPGSELMPGMVCKASLHNDADSNDKKIIIPNKSVQISPDNRRFVWLADDNTARRQFITVGSLSDYGIIVENGLSEGNKVIVDGHNKISEGMQIIIVQ